MISRKTAIFLFSAIIFLNGCAYFKKKPPPHFNKYISWKMRQAELRQIKKWKARGVFSIAYGRKRDTASFNWQQKLDDYTIEIFGPMNVGGMKIVGDLDKVRCWYKSREVIEADTPEQLLYEQMGWNLPISNLRYWILGFPAMSRVDYKYFDRYGRLYFFRQDGWQVKYAGFKYSFKSGIDSPQIIELKNKRVAIKIKIKEQVLY